MAWSIWPVIFIISPLLSASIEDGDWRPEEEAHQYLQLLDSLYCEAANKEMVARWNYITDITTDHEEAMNEARLEFQKLKKEASGNLTQFEWDSYSEPDLARQAKFYFSWGSNISEAQLAEMNHLQTVMESTYSTASICPFDLQAPDCEPTWELEPDLVEVMASSTNYEELTYVWDQWRKASGNKYRWVVVM